MIDIGKLQYDKRVPIEFLIRELFGHLEDEKQGFEAKIGDVFNGQLKLVYEPNGSAHECIEIDSWQPVSTNE